MKKKKEEEEGDEGQRKGRGRRRRRRIRRKASGKESYGGASGCRRLRFDPWRREQQPTPVLLLGESHGQRSLAGSWGCRVGHD